MYDVISHGRMLADSTRIEPFLRALEAAVRPGSVVLDLGAGLGFFALAACRLGARRVYAVESDPVVQVAADLAEANGYGDRVECIQALSTETDLPETVDVIVADLRGILPWFGANIDSVADARERFLAPNGRLIPQRDTLRGALVEAQDVYDERFAVWSSGLYGLDLQVARTLAVNRYWRERVSQDQLLTGAAAGAVLDYERDSEPDMRCTMHWQAERSGTAHGLALWFDTVLAEDIGFSTGPYAPRGVYGSAFFPLERPVSLEPGDEIRVDLAARRFENEYVWRWRTRLAGSDGGETDFIQSSLLGASLSGRDVERRSPSYAPALSGSGEVARHTLGCFDGRMTLETVARRILEEFPEEFQGLDQALARVTALAERFTS